MIVMERNRDFVYLGTFVWDTEKNERNKVKHRGLDFETAVRIFADPFLYSEYDHMHSEQAGEYRVKNLGLLHGVVVLAVWTVEKGGMIRVISARNATPKEVQIYERHAKDVQGY
ncbi:MAG: BrnT family toxin [Treponema sp.]|nr:BrnT family toxin [Treponema sp.]